MQSSATRVASFVGATLLGASIAAAGPVFDGYNDGNSYTQSWFNTNPDVPLGLFTTIVLEFVSQTDLNGNDTGATDFKTVSIHSNGWSKTSEYGAFARGDGPSGATVHFDLGFDGTSSATKVVWNIWYYNGGTALGGYQGSGRGDGAGWSWTDLTADGAPVIPLPSASALAGLGLLAAGVRRRRVGV